MTTSSLKPCRRETSAFVRERGLRPVIVTVVGSVIELRAKGLRSFEVVDVASLYSMAVKARVLSEKREKAAARKARSKK